MMSTANLPHGFWGEVFKTAVHACTRSPHTSLKGDNPKEVWFGKHASYDHLHVFGCEVAAHIRPNFRNKHDSKSIKGLFMEYGEDGKMGYKIWIPQLKKVIGSRDIVFNEARLLQNNCASKYDHKRVRFQHDHPVTQSFG